MTALPVGGGGRKGDKEGGASQAPRLRRSQGVGIYLHSVQGNGAVCTRSRPNPSQPPQLPPQGKSFALRLTLGSGS